MEFLYFSYATARKDESTKVFVLFSSANTLHLDEENRNNRLSNIQNTSIEFMSHLCSKKMKLKVARIQLGATIGIAHLQQVLYQ